MSHRIFSSSLVFLHLSAESGQLWWLSATAMDISRWNSSFAGNPHPLEFQGRPNFSSAGDTKKSCGLFESILKWSRKINFHYKFRLNEAACSSIACPYNKFVHAKCIRIRTHRQMNSNRMWMGIYGLNCIIIWPIPWRQHKQATHEHYMFRSISTNTFRLCVCVCVRNNWNNINRTCKLWIIYIERMRIAQYFIICEPHWGYMSYFIQAAISLLCEFQFSFHLNVSESVIPHRF